MSESITGKTLQLTYNLSKDLIRKTKIKRVPKAIRKLTAFLKEHTKADTIKLDPILNKYCWSKAINKLPRKVRMNVSIEMNEKDDGTTEKIARATYVPVDNFKGLKSIKLESEE